MRTLAEENGIKWELPTEHDGTVPRSLAWNLNAICGVPAPPSIIFQQLGSDTKIAAAMKELPNPDGVIYTHPFPLSRTWQELTKAVLVEELLAKRTRPRGALSQVARPIRIIGTVVHGTEPWEIRPEQISEVLALTAVLGKSGKITELVRSVVKLVIDRNQLAYACPLLPAVDRIVTSRVDAEDITRGRQYAINQSIKRRRPTEILKSLAQRPGDEKLPEQRAFWELLRIICTERAATFSDALRFEESKLVVATGFRCEEMCMIPAEWREIKHYIDVNGRPAGEHGALSTSLAIRHFAEKQRGYDCDAHVLWPAVQDVPEIFREIVEEACANALRLTAPLRARLRKQTETGRIFPDWQPRQEVSFYDAYRALTGDIRLTDVPPPSDLVTNYWETFNPEICQKIWDGQLAEFECGAPLRNKIREYFASQDGFPWWDGQVNYFDGVVIAGELEDWVRRTQPTKIPDTAPFSLGSGEKLYPWQLMFLVPKRALLHERDHQVMDFGHYYSIGRVTGEDLQFHLGDSHGTGNTIFARYGQTNEDRALTMNTHAPRHLQNTELFRLGVSDTIISKRFNRKSIAQSHEYDHRSLLERLDAISLPDSAASLPDKAQIVAKLALSGIGKGPVIQKFLQLQRDQGDAVAFEFLAAEADGFQITPYGACTNSFLVDGCPNHLECFKGCNHLARTDDPAEDRNLAILEGRMVRAVTEIEARPGNTIGRANQLCDAQTKLAHVRKLRATAPGELAFPDGEDLSDPVGTPKSILDMPRRKPKDHQ